MLFIREKHAFFKIGHQLVDLEKKFTNILHSYEILFKVLIKSCDTALFENIQALFPR